MNADNTNFGPAPLMTPIAQEPDDFGVPLADRGSLPGGRINISWVGWFNAIYNRLIRVPWVSPVATFSFTAKTTSIGVTNLRTRANSIAPAGNYRVSVYLTGNGIASNINGAVAWTDNYFANLAAANIVFVGAALSATYTFYFYSNGTADITFSTVVIGGPPTYDAFVELEKMP